MANQPLAVPRRVKFALLLLVLIADELAPENATFSGALHLRQLLVVGVVNVAAAVDNALGVNQVLQNFYWAVAAFHAIMTKVYLALMDMKSKCADE
jgi:hypothetical protein